PYLRKIWLDETGGFTWSSSLADLDALAEGTDAPGPELLAAVEREVSPADPAVIIYTSGSTARPKAVIHRHWALARHSPELARNFALTADDRMMCLLPAFWLAGMSMVTQVLSIGASLVYTDSPMI